jgi:acetylornithine deacetylase/succinyl-diaminopimelate desuccinylase-like protein
MRLTATNLITRRIGGIDADGIHSIFLPLPTRRQAGFTVDKPLTAAIGAAVQQLFPQAVMVDDLQPSFTDAHWFRDKGIASYGFPIFSVSAADKARVHGNDERGPIAAYTDGVRLVWQVVYNFSRSR